MPPFDLDDEPAALLYLINLTAGLLDGDGHLLELAARAGTRAVVTGQAASRIHPAGASFCSQQWSIEVEDDALLVVLPGPTIPYRGSRFFQRGRVELSATGRIIWGDIWLAGRYERGAASERFAFDRIVQDFEVRRSGRLLYRDRFRWDGPWSRSDVDWYFGGALASGSLYASGPLPVALPEPPPGLRQAIFPLGAGGSCLRWCGHPTVVTEVLVRTALQLAADWSGSPDSPPWLLRSSGLANNHWFSTPPPSGRLCAGAYPVASEK
jgi:urease accessory protein